MKTPDEIKKGLMFCGDGDLFAGGCEDCNYRHAGCSTALSVDALAYIEQLEAKISELLRGRDDLTATNTQLRDVVFKNELFKRRLEEERSVFEAQVPRWISVEERLPETCAETRSFYHSVTVLASENGRIMMGYFTASKDDGSYDFTGVDSHKKFYDFAKPSHWMPLPEPPKEE